jgi:predicted RNA-binding protein YlqC (UPF0109 family)
MQELIEMIVKALVDSPEQVSVRRVEGERSIIFEVRVPPSDLGKVIGKQGRIANSLRTLVRAAGTKQGKSVWVAINSTADAEQEEKHGSV